MVSICEKIVDFIDTVSDSPFSEFKLFSSFYSSSRLLSRERGTKMTGDGAPRIKCRQITEADIPALIDLLGHGFPERSKAYWAQALEKLALREAPPAYPRFG